MIVTCSSCSTRLQLDDAKIPSHAFSVRCPNCSQVVNAEPSVEPQAANVNGSQASAPRTQDENVDGIQVSPVGVTPSAETSEDEMARLLALLRRGVEEKTDSRGILRRPSWERRRALLCVGSVHRHDLSKLLSASNYDVQIAENTTQAFERLREEKIDVIVLDNEFHVEGQGAALVNREISSMRMADRRRTVLVHLSSTLRTGDAHGAFLSNVNLIVNTADFRQFPLLLDKNIRDLNELYRDFNRANNMAEL